MSKQAVVCVATTQYLRVGMMRLWRRLGELHPTLDVKLWKREPPGCPLHSQVPYAFKAAAMAEAVRDGFSQVLWCDASIYPVRRLDPIWNHAAEHGVWIARNGGYNNYEWTADSAYPDLFPNAAIESARRINRTISHAVGTAIAIDIGHPVGSAFFAEYHRLALTTKALCGPWINSLAPDAPTPDGVRCAPCGPPDVRGHRHDQSALAVLAWRAGIPLDESPVFAYGVAGAPGDDRTILLADGSYR